MGGYHSVSYLKLEAIDFCMAMKIVELYPESVFSVGIRSVFLRITNTILYRRKTRSVFSVSKLWREPLKKLAGAPFFLRRGGGPLFVHFALLLKKKKEFPRNFSKKESLKCVPAKVYSEVEGIQGTGPQIIT